MNTNHIFVQSNIFHFSPYCIWKREIYLQQTYRCVNIFIKISSISFPYEPLIMVQSCSQPPFPVLTKTYMVIKRYKADPISLLLGNFWIRHHIATPVRLHSTAPAILMSCFGGNYLLWIQIEICESDVRDIFLTRVYCWDCTRVRVCVVCVVCVKRLDERIWIVTALWIAAM